jgi:diguanylate cyclase (GGDEF)-like protein
MQAPMRDHEPPSADAPATGVSARRVVVERSWAIAHLDADAVITHLDGPFLDATLRGTSLVALLTPEDGATLMAVIANPPSATQLHLRLRGTSGWHLTESVVTCGPDGTTTMVMHDITAEISGADLLARAQRRSRSVIDSIELACAEMAIDGRVVHANEAWRELTGSARHLLAVVPGCEDLRAALGTDPRLLELDGFALHDGAELSVRVIVADDGLVLATAATRTRDRRSNRTPARAVEADGIDAVTGLLSRAGLNAGWETFRAELPVAVIVMDLAGFRAVNDQHGHAVGDLVLRSVARQLRTATRPGDLLARLGGDEFALVCRDVDDHIDLISIAGRLRDSLEADIEFDDPVWGPCLWPIAASVGAVLGDVADGLGTLLRQADDSMKRDQAQRRRELDEENDDESGQGGADPATTSTHAPMATVHPIRREGAPGGVTAAHDPADGDDTDDPA